MFLCPNVFLHLKIFFQHNKLVWQFSKFCISGRNGKLFLGFELFPDITFHTFHVKQTVPIHSTYTGEIVEHFSAGFCNLQNCYSSCQCFIFTCSDAFAWYAREISFRFLDDLNSSRWQQKYEDKSMQISMSIVLE